MILGFFGQLAKYARPKPRNISDDLLFSQILDIPKFLSRCMMIIDTGARPNCIARKAQPPRMEELINPFFSNLVLRAVGKRLGIAESIVLEYGFDPTQ
eukprot:IDg19878t1